MQLPFLGLQVGIPTPAQVAAAAANVVHRVTEGSFADLTPMPRALVDTGPLRAVHRYDPLPGREPQGRPVLLVPPLAAPALCFDLRRGCSLVEYLLGHRTPTYLVDYGPVAFSDRHLGLEHWIDDVIPGAVRAVHRETGQAPVLVAWSLGGALALLAHAADASLPVAGVVAVGTPFDVTLVPMMAPLRPLVQMTRGSLGTVVYRTLGGAPAPLVARAFRLASLDKELSKPLAKLLNLDDRDFLAQLEAVEHFQANMLAYPGRTFGQLYHRFLRSNDLATGVFRLGERRIALADVAVPVMAVAGLTDAIAPVRSVHKVADVLTGSPEVRLSTAPGGHLGVLTGRRARTTTWPDILQFLADQGVGRPATQGDAPAGLDAPS